MTSRRYGRPVNTYHTLFWRGEGKGKRDRGKGGKEE